MAIYNDLESITMTNVDAAYKQEQGESEYDEGDVQLPSRGPMFDHSSQSESQTSHSTDPEAIRSSSLDLTVEEFLSAEDGSSLMNNFQYGSETPILHRSSTLVSTRSAASLATLLPSMGGYGGQLDHLCRIIGTHRKFRFARIRSTECYSRSIGFGVVHRYLLLELERDGKKTIWLRLDRRPSRTVNTWKFIRSRGCTGANDTIQLSSQKEALVDGQDKRENRQTFNHIVTLLDLRLVLYIVIDHLVTYQVWPRNCWFFVSLIQDTLSDCGAGSFTERQIFRIGIDRRTRRIIIREVHESRLAALVAHRFSEVDDGTIIPSDVASYIRSTLEQDYLAVEDNEINRIVECAAGSLVWAVTACRFIFCLFHQSQSPLQVDANRQYPRFTMRRVIDFGGGSLPALYRVILDHCSGFTTFTRIFNNMNSCLCLSGRLPWSTLCKSAPSHFESDVFFPLPMVSDCYGQDPMISAPHPSFLEFLEKEHGDYLDKMSRFRPDPTLIRQIEDHKFVDG